MLPWLLAAVLELVLVGGVEAETSCAQCLEAATQLATVLQSAQVLQLQAAMLQRQVCPQVSPCSPLHPAASPTAPGRGGQPVRGPGGLLLPRPGLVSPPQPPAQGPGAVRPQGRLRQPRPPGHQPRPQLPGLQGGASQDGRVHGAGE